MGPRTVTLGPLGFAAAATCLKVSSPQRHGRVPSSDCRASRQGLRKRAAREGSPGPRQRGSGGLGHLPAERV